MSGAAIRNAAVLSAVAAVPMIFAPLARAEQPFRLDSQVEDRVGALDGREGSVQAAIDELQEDERIQLWVTYVDSFSGVGAQEWADETAERSDLGLERLREVGLRALDRCRVGAGRARPDQVRRGRRYG